MSICRRKLACVWWQLPIAKVYNAIMLGFFAILFSDADHTGEGSASVP
jgi:hypothetical protein